MRVETPITGEWVLDDGRHVPLGRAVLIELDEEWPDMILEWVVKGEPWAGRSIVAHVVTWAGRSWTATMPTPPPVIEPTVVSTVQRIRWGDDTHMDRDHRLVAPSTGASA